MTHAPPHDHIYIILTYELFYYCCCSNWIINNCRGIESNFVLLGKPVKTQITIFSQSCSTHLFLKPILTLGVKSTVHYMENLHNEVQIMSCRNINHKLIDLDENWYMGVFRYAEFISDSDFWYLDKIRHELLIFDIKCPAGTRKLLSRLLSAQMTHPVFDPFRRDKYCFCTQITTLRNTCLDTRRKEPTNVKKIIQQVTCERFSNAKNFQFFLMAYSFCSEHLFAAISKKMKKCERYSGEMPPEIQFGFRKSRSQRLTRCVVGPFKSKKYFILMICDMVIPSTRV